jgi:Cu(I)/Ag(I) efflux system membrane fusion protein
MVLLGALVAGIVIGGLWWPEHPDATTTSVQGGREVLYWQAPMEPGYRRDEPGKSPMGMDLVPMYAEDVDAVEGVVTIDPAVVGNLGVRIAAAEYGALPRRIETVGYVGFDEDTLQHIHTRVDGWIEKLETKAAGDPVREGQLLFELYSPTLVNAQQEYLASARSGTATLVEASRMRLLALGVTRGEIERLDRERTVSQRVSIRADSDGFVAHLGVREGVYVMPATEIMSIAKLDRVWIQAEVFERQAAWVRTGQRAEVELDYLPGTRWRGTVDYVYPELDPKTRTLRVRLRFSNVDEVLRPGMFARVTLYGTETGPVVHVPRASLIRGGSGDRVVLALGDGRFRSQAVRVGIESGDRIAIESGLSAGDRVVTSAQFLIDSESNIDTALMRMDNEADVHSGHSMPSEDASQNHDDRSMEPPQ